MNRILNRRSIRVALIEIGPRPGVDEAATEATCRYIERPLEELGCAPQREEFEAQVATISEELRPDGTVVTFFSYDEPRVGTNIIAELPGMIEPGAVVELGAHYETVISSPGADDNATGVAALLEAARVMREVRPACTIRFIFFALEEDDFQGSRAHVAQMPEVEREQFLGMLGLDMVGVASHEPDTQRSAVNVPLMGWGSTADFVLVLGNFSSGGLGNALEDSIDAHVPELSFYSLNRIGGWFDDGYRSDHVPYW